MREKRSKNENMAGVQRLYIAAGILFYWWITVVSGSLIASSEVQMCSRDSPQAEPIHASGEHCSKKFVVSLAVRNGKGQSGSIYASIKFVEEKGSSEIPTRQQLAKPFRISVTKSDVYVVYPLRYVTTVNNGPIEKQHIFSSWKLELFGDLGGQGKMCTNRIRQMCPGKGFCCQYSHAERWGKLYTYKRGYGQFTNARWNRRHMMGYCAYDDRLWWRVFDIDDPYIAYRINVTVQQVDYTVATNSKDGSKTVWKTVGYATIGPQMHIDNTNRKKPGVTSGPQILAEWQGDFATTSYFQSFNTKYLLVPDWRAQDRSTERSQSERNAFKDPEQSDEVQAGPTRWLLVDKAMTDLSGYSCNKIGLNSATVLSQDGKCHRKLNSCFHYVPRILHQQHREMEKTGIRSHFFPTFYGDFVGIQGAIGGFDEFEENALFEGDLQDTNGLYTNDRHHGLKLIYRSSQVHNSLVTLTFTADSVTFVENRSPGRIVESIIEDFSALAGSGMLTVTAQNTGGITADFSVSIQACTEGIIQVSQKTKTLDPRQQETFVFEMSSSLNIDFEHNCTVMLFDNDGNVLDSKLISFKTMEGCVYCPDGVCECQCKAEGLSDLHTNPMCSSHFPHLDFSPFDDVIIIEHKPCYHCWFTNSFKHPATGTFTVVVFLMAIGMCKMMFVHSCCRTKDGRYVDVAGIIMGTASEEHTAQKSRSMTIQFLMGVCFFVYLPLLPIIMVFCSWRQRKKARVRLKKKAERKQLRQVQKKRAALLAMKGLMIQENMTMEEAVKLMEEGQRAPDRIAPMLPPKVLVVSSSSDTDKQDFDYPSSPEDITDLSKKKAPKPKVTAGLKQRRPKGRGKGQRGPGARQGPSHDTEKSLKQPGGRAIGGEGREPKRSPKAGQSKLVDRSVTKDRKREESGGRRGRGTRPTPQGRKRRGVSKNRGSRQSRKAKSGSGKGGGGGGGGEHSGKRHRSSSKSSKSSKSSHSSKHSKSSHSSKSSKSSHSSKHSKSSHSSKDSKSSHSSKSSSDHSSNSSHSSKESSKSHSSNASDSSKHSSKCSGSNKSSNVSSNSQLLSHSSKSFHTASSPHGSEHSHHTNSHSDSHVSSDQQSCGSDASLDHSDYTTCDSGDIHSLDMEESQHSLNYDSESDEGHSYDDSGDHHEDSYEASDHDLDEDSYEASDHDLDDHHDEDDYDDHHDLDDQDFDDHHDEHNFSDHDHHDSSDHDDFSNHDHHDFSDHSLDDHHGDHDFDDHHSQHDFSDNDFHDQYDFGDHDFDDHQHIGEHHDATD